MLNAFAVGEVVLLVAARGWGSRGGGSRQRERERDAKRKWSTNARPHRATLDRPEGRVRRLAPPSRIRDGAG